MKLIVMRPETAKRLYSPVINKKIPFVLLAADHQ